MFLSFQYYYEHMIIAHSAINQSDRIETETVKVSDEWEICR